MFIPNLSSSIEVLLADERYYFLCNLSKDYSSGNICQSDMLQEFFFFPSIFQGIYHCHALFYVYYVCTCFFCLLLLCCLLYFLLHTCQFMFLTFIKKFPSLSTMTSCIFSQIHLFYKLCSDLLYKDLLTYSLYKIFKLLEFLFLQYVPDVFISPFIISL